MQVTSSTNNIYTSNTNNIANTQDVDKKYKDNAIPKDELKPFYANENETNNITQEESTIDNFLEELYNTNSIESASELVKGDIKSKVDEYAQTLDKELNSTQKSEMINEYKQELLKEYKNILEASSDEKMTLQQQAMIKTLLDENNTETSYLESLLSQKNNSVQSKDSTNNGANYYMQSLDAKGNEIMNNILSGRSDTEKFAIKGIMDRGLNFENTEAYAMALAAFNDYNGISNIDNGIIIKPNNNQDYLMILDSYIKKIQTGVDQYGILEVAQQLRREYTKGDGTVES